MLRKATTFSLLPHISPLSCLSHFCFLVAPYSAPILPFSTPIAGLDGMQLQYQECDFLGWTCASENRRPVVDKHPEKNEDGGYASGGWKSDDGKLSWGYSSIRGKRATMEDFFDIKMSKVDGQTVCLFGIFDGHGGSRAAEFLKDHLFENLMKHPKFLMDTKVAISETYQRTDAEFLSLEKETSRDDGSTASTALLVGNHLYVANVGDSRAIISKGGEAIPLSEDHKPNRTDERRRIEKAGGVVMWAGTWRVGGVLAMSRAFGNKMLKQFVVADPDIQDLEVDKDVELLILASDGLWDVVRNEDAVLVAGKEEEPEAAARKLTEAAFTRGSADNITCIVVKFHHDDAEKYGLCAVSNPLQRSDILRGYEAIANMKIKG
ncbi:putative protein phosphatase 2C 76, partial [Cucurbita argyrosperma subsp. sororia]